MRQVILVCIGVFALSSCSLIPRHFQNDVSIKVIDEKMYFDGYITEPSLKKFEQAITPETRSLYISSSGGEIEPAYKMMDLVMERQLTLIATGPCISACSIIASGAKSVEVQEGAYLGFHWNAESNPAQLAGAANFNQIPKIEAFIKKERQINESLGVSQKLYEDAWRLVNLRQDGTPGFAWYLSLAANSCGVELLWLPCR